MLPLSGRYEAEDGAQQCCLAGAVRAEHADELAGRDLQADARQQVWPPSLNVTSPNSMAFTARVHRERQGRLGERVLDRVELADDPSLVALARRLGLGDPDDRHADRGDLLQRGSSSVTWLL